MAYPSRIVTPLLSALLAVFARVLMPLTADPCVPSVLEYDPRCSRGCCRGCSCGCNRGCNRGCCCGCNRGCCCGCNRGCCCGCCCGCCRRCRRYTGNCGLLCPLHSLCSMFSSALFAEPVVFQIRFPTILTYPLETVYRSLLSAFFAVSRAAFVSITVSKLWQPSNIYGFRYVMLSGIVIDDKPEHPANAP